MLLALCSAKSADSEPQSDEFAYLGQSPGQRHPESAAPGQNIGPGEWFGEKLPWWNWSRLTGDWNSLRTKAETNGWSFAGRYVTDASTLLSGGLRPGAVLRGLLDVNLAFDPQAAWNLAGGKFFAQYYFRHGPNGSKDAGDLQGYSDLDGPALNQVEELWYEQKLLNDRFRFKIGQVDANAEFDFTGPAGDFLNSSAGHSPTLLEMPTYPNPALSANLFLYPTEWSYCGVGIYGDNLRRLCLSQFKHPYLIGEVGLTSPQTIRFGSGRLAAGFWRDTGTVNRLDGRRENNASGFFAVAEQQLWRSGDTNSSSRVDLFAQYGYANANVSPFEHHVGLGLHAADLIPGRNGDTAGLYASWVKLSRAAGAPFDRDEMTIEWFYCLQIIPFYSLQPDLQWIHNPGGHASARDVWAATVRISLKF